MTNMTGEGGSETIPFDVAPKVPKPNNIIDLTDKGVNSTLPDTDNLINQSGPIDWKPPVQESTILPESNTEPQADNPDNFNSFSGDRDTKVSVLTPDDQLKEGKKSELGILDWNEKKAQELAREYKVILKPIDKNTPTELDEGGNCKSCGQPVAKGADVCKCGQKIKVEESEQALAA